MMNHGSFVSIPNDLVGEGPSTLPNVDTPESMEYIGHSTGHTIYWNKKCPSFGLLCGPSVDTINSVARLFVRSHLEKEPGEQKCARVMVLHTGNHLVYEASPSLLEAKDGTMLLSPRVMQGTNHTVGRHSRWPLWFSEEDISVYHVLSLFTPPPEMHHASASRILTTVQYVLSQLPTEGPFDLQAFIQLVEQEKWDDEGSTFIALRQTLLTELLAPRDDDLDTHGTRLQLNALDKVVLDLTDSILCSTRLDGVLMDIALHAFLNRPFEQNRRTMIVLSAADEYLHASSPLLRSLRSLRSLASEGRHNTRILAMTTNLPCFNRLPGVFDAMDYVALAGPLRSSTWFETIKSHWISTVLPEPLRQNISRTMLAIISPDSQLLQSTHDGERWGTWGDGCLCVDLDHSLLSRHRRAVADDVFEVVEQPRTAVPAPPGGDMSILNTSNRVDLGTVESFAISHPITSIAEVGLDPLPPSAPPPLSHRGPALPQQGTVTARDNDSDSEGSSREEDYPNVALGPISPDGDLFYNGTLLRPDLIPFFRIKTDLPPEAFIKASVEVGMYPDTFRLLATTILRLSGGYSNVGVAQNDIGVVIRPFMKQMKAHGYPLPFKSFTKMVKSAWKAHILRNFVLENRNYVFLVNTRDAIDRLNLRGASGSLGSSRINLTRTVSPYFPLVNSIAHLAGKRAFTPAPFTIVRREVGGKYVVKSLGFFDFAQYVDDASSLNLVTKQGTGKNRTLSLRSDWNHLQSLLVLRPDVAEPHV